MAETSPTETQLQQSRLILQAKQRKTGDNHKNRLFQIQVSYVHQFPQSTQSASAAWPQ